MTSDKQSDVRGEGKDSERRPKAGKMTDEEKRIAERFLKSPGDQHWPATPMQRRMQGAGR